ncbi:MAG: nucleotidyltransferase domain-containing protein [Limnothrix sp. CACIAM 69d]|nr:MAG: nucleotidyltransferase domain-containing protein [Limnothrix sp. CACIAM 69d]
MPTQPISGNTSPIAAPIPAALTPLLRTLKSQLQTLWGDRLVHLILFGSRARGDAQPNSDIDVAIVLKNFCDLGAELQLVGQPICNLCLQYDVVISPVFLDESFFLQNNGMLMRNIRKEGVVV